MAYQVAHRQTQKKKHHCLETLPNVSFTLQGQYHGSCHIALRQSRLCHHRVALRRVSERLRNKSNQIPNHNDRSDNKIAFTPIPRETRCGDITNTIVHNMPLVKWLNESVFTSNWMMIVAQIANNETIFRKHGESGRTEYEKKARPKCKRKELRSRSNEKKSYLSRKMKQRLEVREQRMSLNNDHARTHKQLSVNYKEGKLQEPKNYAASCTLTNERMARAESRTILNVAYQRWLTDIHRQNKMKPQR